ncbi:uroporphyrinogen-III synthase [Marinobacter litoralis]|uniref:uroporphyrinogen-III synthase n=1 Tax=Marinobacter litoralis TaxID=187981 RepID=UPI0018EDF6EA|nr:uroporphyrinogen-III synthase [Marinobacter litoralis]MBJ6135989.1 uroporphyrinogen-III synthase [Marinobacter litoralis]
MATPQPDRRQCLYELAGRRILICRPEPEASRLAEAFRAAGADCRTMPLLVREPLPETPEQRTLLQELDNFSHVIAVSPFAANLLLDHIDNWWPQIPLGLQWYGVGSGTSSVFARHGLKARQPKQGWTSEALLELPSLQNLAGDKVLLARGEQGRELIRQTLEQRGAKVSVLPLYRRAQPYYPPEQVDEIFGSFRPEVIIALSGETLNNLNALAPDHHSSLHRTLVVVPAERVARQAENAGFRNLIVPNGLDDQNLVTSVASTLAARS